MKLNVLNFALALGILGLIYMIAITYYPWLSLQVLGIAKGEELKAFIANIYPFYDSKEWYEPVLGMFYGFCDCFIFGLLLAGLYNLPLLRKKSPVKKAAPLKVAKKRK